MSYRVHISGGIYTQRVNGKNVRYHQRGSLYHDREYTTKEAAKRALNKHYIEQVRFNKKYHITTHRGGELYLKKVKPKNQYGLGLDLNAFMGYGAKRMNFPRLI